MLAMWAHTFTEKNIKILQSFKALDFAYSCACNRYLLLMMYKSHSWQAWRDSWGCLNPSSASSSPGRGCAVWDHFEITLLNCPFTGRDEVAFLLSMPVPICRQGWSDLSGQRHKGHPFPGMAPPIQGKTPCARGSWELRLFLGSAPLPCLAGDRQQLAKLSDANTELLLPAATCCTWWQLLFLYWNSFLANNLCVTSWEPDLALW